MKTTLFVRFALSALLVFLGCLQLFNAVNADSPAVKCPAETSELIFMSEDESACYYQHDLPHSNGFEVVTIKK